MKHAKKKDNEQFNGNTRVCREVQEGADGFRRPHDRGACARLDLWEIQDVAFVAGAFERSRGGARDKGRKGRERRRVAPEDKERIRFMSLIEQTLFGRIDKVKTAIERLKLAELSREPLHVCYSGGKDSKVVRRLCEMAGVSHELHYSITSVDHPSIVREIFSDPKVIVDKPRDENGKQLTMWSLIVKKKIPPTRLFRYCCEELKEHSGRGRICVTGVRKAESVSRALNGGVVKIIGKSAAKIQGIDIAITPKRGVVFNLDNADNRRIIEQCYRTSKTLINPIIDWTDADVWEFSRAENIQQSELYIENGGRYRRLGCILCPLATCKQRETEARDYPQIKGAYIRAFQKMIEANKDVDYKWRTGEEVYEWWLYGNKKSPQLKGQLSMFDAHNLAEVGNHPQRS